MREIDVQTFIDSMGTGTSRPALIIGDDFNQYILKNQRTTDRLGNSVDCNSLFINELLAYQIGCYLDVPMPEAVIAFVDEQLVNDDPKIRFAYRFEKGKFFASERLKYLENNLEDNFLVLQQLNKPYRKTSWVKFFEGIGNKEDISKIIAFDVFIANIDRYANEGNILINSEHPNKMYAIDHGHAFFGPIWDMNKKRIFNSINSVDAYTTWYCGEIFKYLPGRIFHALQEYVDLTDSNNNPFNEVVNKIENIDVDMILLWMNTIPQEWYVDKQVQIASYSDFLLKHKIIVKRIIDIMVSAELFVNYRGGGLQWNNQKVKSHTVY